MIVLYALGIENLLKAIIVATGQDPIGANRAVSTRVRQSVLAFSERSR